MVMDNRREGLPVRNSVQREGQKDLRAMRYLESSAAHQLLRTRLKLEDLETGHLSVLERHQQHR